MKFKKIYAPIARILMLGLLSLSLVGCAIDFDALTGANASRETVSYTHLTLPTIYSV